MKKCPNCEGVLVSVSLPETPPWLCRVCSRGWWNAEIDAAHWWDPENHSWGSASRDLRVLQECEAELARSAEDK